MDYEVYHYHGCKHITRPKRTTGNIKGLELEISDYDASDYLDELVEDNILTIPYNEDEDKEFTICIEDDSSVYKELIFKACCNQTLLKAVKTISNRLGNIVTNSHSTSCHIHINNNFLREKNIRRKDIVKATEFLAPILYEISGRNKSSYEQWAKSGIHHLIDITDTNLLKRAELVDEELGTHNGRYAIVNCGSENTTEIRIFSNYYNFNYDYIKMYIETVDFIIKLAEKMKYKKYKTEYNKIIKDIKQFFSQRKYKNIYEKHCLEIFFASAKERQLIELNRELRYIRNKMTYLKNILQTNTNTINKRTNAIELLRVLRDYANKYELKNMTIELDNYNIDILLEKIENNINNRIKLIEQEE